MSVSSRYRDRLSGCDAPVIQTRGRSLALYACPSGSNIAGEVSVVVSGCYQAGASGTLGEGRALERSLQGRWSNASGGHTRQSCNNDHQVSHTPVDMCRRRPRSLTVTYKRINLSTKVYIFQLYFYMSSTPHPESPPGTLSNLRRTRG